jgi:hypothetical protein
MRTPFDELEGLSISLVVVLIYPRRGRLTASQAPEEDLGPPPFGRCRLGRAL